MIKVISTSTTCLLATSISQAAIVAPLDLPAAGQYASPAGITVVTAVTDPSGATFDITYNLSAIAGGANPFVTANATQIGVGSEADIAAHFTTLEGKRQRRPRIRWPLRFPTFKRMEQP